MTFESRSYRNPPVVEVVCEFVFDPASKWDFIAPAIVAEELKESFPKRDQVTTYTTTFSQEETQIQQQVRSVDRYVLRREDNSVIIQMSPHFLSISNPKPYLTWQGYRPLIEQALSAYRKAANPKGIEHVTLRYTNQISLPPSGSIELGDYFGFYPFLVESLEDQPYSAFTVGVQFPRADGRDLLEMQMTPGPGTREDDVTFVLVLTYAVNRIGDVTFEVVPEWLESAHTAIRFAFDSCIKEPLRVRFEEVQGDE